MSCRLASDAMACMFAIFVRASVVMEPLAQPIAVSGETSGNSDAVSAARRQSIGFILRLLAKACRSEASTKLDASSEEIC
ncbi:hypothetical protein JY96_21280 [Aquabacterium sp. NJ1]|nr:hypothetical protein JY96_21280 [Aquabacterium sp. NJ1]